MYLKSIYLHGFKSFADKTTLDFSSGVTGVVGPNGCGKSNVVDAVRWVLGETSAKALRGDEMADVIFSGTDKRRPLGAAEVTLTMADCEEALGVDYNEVAITRRVSREGKGEYFINNTRCRLRDIHDLFADTGIGRSAYSIMAQGQIDQILSSRPEDRRSVFEEAAGITRFKSQKKEALRKLDHTDANLLRVTDIIEEVGRQRSSLQRQAAKAKRYRSVKSELRVLEGHFLHKQWLELAREELSTREQSRSTETQLQELTEATEVRQRGLLAQRESLEQLSERLDESERAVVECENTISKAQQRVSFNQERQGELAQATERIETEIQNATQGLSSQQGELEAANSSIADLETHLQGQESQVQEAEAVLKQKSQERNKVSVALNQAQQRSQKAAREHAALLARIEQQQQQLVQLEGRAEHLVADEAAVAEHEAEARDRLERLEQETQSAATQLEEREAAAKAAKAETQEANKAFETQSRAVETKRKELNLRSSRLQVLQDLLAQGEGLESGAQAVMQGLPGRDSELLKNGVRGTLASFLQIKDSAHETAIEAALGSSLQAIVLADENLLEATAKLLHEKQLGQALLTSEETRASSTQSKRAAAPESAIAWASDLVEASPKVTNLVSAILGQILIVPTLEEALKLRQQWAKQATQTTSSLNEFPIQAWVSLDGQSVFASGLVQGGAGEQGISLIKRQQEVRDLSAEVETLETELQQAERQLEQARARKESAATSLEEKKNHWQQLQSDHSALKASLSSARRELETASNRLSSLVWEREQVDSRAQELATALETGRAALDTEEAQEAQENEQIETHQQALKELQSSEEEARQALAEQRTTLAVEQKSLHSLRAQRQPMNQRLQELQKLLERRNQELISNQQRMEQAAQENTHLESEIEQKQQELVAHQAQVQESKSLRDQRREQLQSVEKELRELQAQLQTQQSAQGNLSVRLTQLELKLDHLEEQARERLGLRLPQFIADWALLESVLAGGEAPEWQEERPKEEHPTPNQQEQNADSPQADQDEQPQAKPQNEGAPTQIDSTQTDSTQESEFAPYAAQAEPAQNSRNLKEQIQEAEIPEHINWQQIENRVSDLRRKLDGMGSVNLDAISEFEELVERYEFLTKQHEDLIQAKEILLETIARLNKESRSRFVDTFEQVRSNFRRIFGELFGKGAQANLVLMDEEDPLESGIEVIAKPPGKKLQSISLLSGGERSMTAVALLFSIYQVKPSPFCILDELDAPLDESNIGRFVSMLERFIDQSQFIIVTHSKRTMQRCDVLYGVTMEEFGVSKPVGMRLSAAQEVVDQDTQTQANSSKEKSASEKAALKLSAG